MPGGFGKHVAEWMVQGEPSIDMAEADANRFYPFMTTPPYVLERGKQQYREVYDILHPRQQMARPRKLRLTPFYARHEELGAEFVTGAGWERPEWFEANAALVPADAPWVHRDGWAGTFWSPIEGAEHLATRSSAALFDLTPFAKFDVEGPDALAYLERICANRIDRPVGSIVYTAMLTPAGGIRCDLTIARKGEELFRVVTGGGSGQHDLAWMRRQIGEDERVRITERTGSLFALGLWGPNAREILGGLTDADLGNEAFPYMTARYLDVGEVGPVWAQRISYAGELGWELYGQFAMGDRLWELVWDAGRDHGLVAAGLGAFDTLRLEKGYRLWGQDIHTEHDPFEAGLGFAVKMDKGAFQGREALAAVLERGSAERLACVTLDDPDRGRAGQGADPVRRARGRLRDVRRVRLLGRALHRLRLPARRAGGAGHAGRGRVLRRAAPGHGRRGPAVGPEGRTIEGVTRSRRPDHAGKESSLAVIDNPGILLYTRIRKSPYFYASREHGVARYSVYNHTYHPRHYGDPVAEYWHLVNGVTMWDVGVEKQIQIKGPDAFDLTNMIVPRDLNKCAVNECKYVFITGPDGGILNDPVLLRVAEDEFWLSLADSDVNLYALGIAAREGHGRHGAGDRRRARADPGPEREEGAHRAVRRARARDPVLRPDAGRARRDGRRGLAHRLHG